MGVEISDKQKLYIGLGILLFIVVTIFLGGIYVGSRYGTVVVDCPECEVCETSELAADPCPIADHEYVEIILYPTASVACNKVPESGQWLCSPVVFRGPEGEPGKMPEEVTVRLLEAPEAAAKKEKGGNP